MEYISALTDSLGTPMVKTKHKTGFLGFFVATKSVGCLFKELISNTSVPMSYLLTYKLSQDYLELFFASIRSSGGWNNNPSARKFMASYKLLLLRYEVSATGNCAALDNPRILHPIKDTTTINHQPSTINQGNDIGVADMSVIRRYDLQARLEPQHDYNDAPNSKYA